MVEVGCTVVVVVLVVTVGVSETVDVVVFVVGVVNVVVVMAEELGTVMLLAVDDILPVSPVVSVVSLVVMVLLPEVVVDSEDVENVVFDDGIPVETGGGTRTMNLHNIVLNAITQHNEETIKIVKDRCFRHQSGFG